ncbi:hypothetical protein D3C72_2423510 [compost metagenome]
MPPVYGEFGRPGYSGVGTGTGLTRTARSTPTIRHAMPTKVSGCGMVPRRMKA